MSNLSPEYRKSRLRELEDKAMGTIELHAPEVPYWVGFSGGKDSIVLKDLVLKSGVKADLNYSMTTIDPPELIRYIKKHHPDINWNRPKAPFFHEMVRRGLPMRPHSRWCCHEYKEAGPNSGSNRRVMLGIRSSESRTRKDNRKIFQPCYRNKSKDYLHPILYWTDEDIWDYIHTHNLPYCSLYDEGFKRLGCVGCPFASQKARDREFKRWPRFAYLWQKFITRRYELCKEEEKPWTELFESGEHLYLAWRGLIEWPKRIKEVDGLFGKIQTKQ